VGAGVGRTGTNSLKLALERLLGAPCYHMIEVSRDGQDDTDTWTAAYGGDLPDWEQLFAGYAACVDWPAGPFWPQISAAFPDALILLSTRDADAWWRSASSTIFAQMSASVAKPGPADSMTRLDAAMMNAFSPGWQDEETAKAAFLAHNQNVRDTAPPDRLLEWTAGDGWTLICDRLGLPVPDEPFPHVNSTGDFRRNTGMDA
jgi:hypothetical protein